MQRTVKKTFIRQWRKAHQPKPLSLDALAERLKHRGVRITHGQLSKIERGLQPYNQRLLEAIAEALGCQPVDLLIRNPADPEGVWTIWETLSPVKKREFVAIGRALAHASTDE